MQQVVQEIDEIAGASRVGRERPAEQRPEPGLGGEPHLILDLVECRADSQYCDAPVPVRFSDDYRQYRQGDQEGDRVAEDAAVVEDAAEEVLADGLVEEVGQQGAYEDEPVIYDFLERQGCEEDY